MAFYHSLHLVSLKWDVAAKCRIELINVRNVCFEQCNVPERCVEKEHVFRFSMCQRELLC